MKTQKEQLFSLLTPLREEQHPLSSDRQLQIWEQIQAGHQQRKERRSRQLLWGAIALAAALLLGLFLEQRPEASKRTDPSLAQDQFAQPGPIQGTARLEAGAELQVKGRLSLLSDDPKQVHLRLEQGQVYSQVPKLQEGARYEVETPQAWVRVRGTRFTVSLEGESTRVEVQEGLVELVPKDGRPILLVAAGEERQLQPINEAGAQAAEAAQDWEALIEIHLRLCSALSESLSQRNHFLELGRGLEAQAPARVMQRFWAEAERRFPQGIHAEEFAYRAAHALLKMGEREAARRAGAGFRARFPQSSRSAEVGGW